MFRMCVLSYIGLGLMKYVCVLLKQREKLAPTISTTVLTQNVNKKKHVPVHTYDLLPQIRARRTHCIFWQLERKMRPFSIHLLD